MRAVLLASATAASFGGLRLSSASSQGDPRPCLACLITAVAPATSTLRSISSPARVILPSRGLPAGEWAFGVSPIQAAKCRPEGNRRGGGRPLTEGAGPARPPPP